MPQFLSPALVAFKKQLVGPTPFIEVLISPKPEGFDLRHRDDGPCAETELRPLQISELATWADFTASGAFRPNKSAPNLRRGWRGLARSDEELELALDALYPGALADWFAEGSGRVPATSFREFTSRQTGLYRRIQDLSDFQAGEVAQAVCHPRFCLRRRRWSVPEVPLESPESKSSVPCWEPCALLLEFARRFARIAAEEPKLEEFRLSEIASLKAALRISLNSGLSEVREGDSGHPANPRRLQRLLARLESSSEDLPPSKEI
ncbi:MAG TPA: DR2241 family protein [Verrucomicrobiota bacterium]|nr:DR2241 family protein [Verrucomicrobiota bacterium]